MVATQQRRGWKTRARALSVLALAGVLAFTAHTVAQQPARARYTPPRTPWGDPDLQGTYTNKDENNTPFERPKDMAGKRLSDFGEAEMRELVKSRLEAAARDARSIGGSAAEDTGAGPSHWYEHLDAVNAQPWLVIEPEDGMVPALVPAARERAAARQAARQGRGPSDSYTDRSLYDRCISRGVPDILRPIIYGASYDITQSPGYVAIRHEMIHETRVIPLDGRPQLPSTIRAYMGDARGWWEGDTLVVRTTNIHPALLYRGAPGSNLTVIERYTPVNKDTISWTARMEDSTTWERPWSIRMPLKRDESQAIFEFGCHEGNRAIANIMSAARADEARQAK
jgi:hypothetical protein